MGSPCRLRGTSEHLPRGAGVWRPGTGCGQAVGRSAVWRGGDLLEGKGLEESKAELGPESYPEVGAVDLFVCLAYAPRSGRGEICCPVISSWICIKDFLPLLPSDFLIEIWSRSHYLPFFV